jgi:hypothetical protein
MAEEEAAVKITLKDVWAAQVETSKQVARLVDQLPTHITQTASDIKEVNDRINDHETRLRKVESRIWMAVGGIGIVSMAIQFVSSVIVK